MQSVTCKVVSSFPLESRRCTYANRFHSPEYMNIQLHPVGWDIHYHHHVTVSKRNVVWGPELITAEEAFALSFRRCFARMISNGAKTTRYKINLMKKFESGSDRWQIAVEQADE